MRLHPRSHGRRPDDRRSQNPPTRRPGAGWAGAGASAGDRVAKWPPWCGQLATTPWPDGHLLVAEWPPPTGQVATAAAGKWPPRRGQVATAARPSGHLRHGQVATTDGGSERLRIHVHDRSSRRAAQRGAHGGRGRASIAAARRGALRRRAGGRARGGARGTGPPGRAPRRPGGPRAPPRRQARQHALGRSDVGRRDEHAHEPGVRRVAERHPARSSPSMNSSTAWRAASRTTRDSGAHDCSSTRRARALAPGAPGELDEQRERALLGAEVGHGQADVGVDRRGQPDVGEVVALRDQLRADEHRALRPREAIEHRLQRALPRRHVRVEPQHLEGREALLEQRLEPLGAGPRGA